MRLIDADALEEILNSEIKLLSDESKGPLTPLGEGRLNAYRNILSSIQSAPTVLGDNLSPAHSEWEMPEETRRQLPTPNPPTK